MTDYAKIEYRVRPVTRYIVTRYHESAEGRTGGSEEKGDFENKDVAYEVAYALCKEEHGRLGYPPGDERICYPFHPDEPVTVAPKTGPVGVFGKKADYVS